MKQKRWFVLAVTGALVVAGGVFLLSRPGDKAGEAPASTLAAAQRRTLEVAAEAAGLVEPIRVVEVKSRASGEVLRALVETGDRVEHGALLAEIDPRDVQNALVQAQADVEAARVQRETAEANRQRMDELRKSQAVTQQELESAVQAAAGARAAVVRAETNLELARERRNDVTIRAPVAGTILLRTVEPGQIIASATLNVSGGTTLFTMADLSEMQVRAKVDETDIGQLTPGQQASVTVEAYPGRVFTGTVYKIEPQAVVEQNVTMFPVLIRLPNPQGLLRPGMNAEVKVQVARRQDVVTVPNSAVVSFREARATAELLGVDAEALRAARGGAPSDGARAANPECAALREKVRDSGGVEAMSEEDRAALRACREGARAPGAESDGGTPSPLTARPRPALVFVQTPQGPAPRRVMLGLSDWEFTEVLSGLEPGEQVILVSMAQMQRQQQELMDRVRQRAGGGMVTGGGGSRGSRTGGR